MLNVPPLKFLLFSTVHNSVEMEVASCEWLHIQDTNVDCGVILFKLESQWDKWINVLRGLCWEIILKWKKEATFDVVMIFM